MVFCFLFVCNFDGKDGGLLLCCLDPVVKKTLTLDERALSVSPLVKGLLMLQ